MTATTASTIAGPVRTVALETLTDEELSVLTPEPGLVVTPYLADVPPEARDLVRRTAFRGLLARGIVNPPAPGSPAPEASGRDDADGSGDVEVEALLREDVRSALTLRQAARTVVAVARTTSLAQDFWYAHVVGDVVLLEEVGVDGLHAFAIGRSEDLPDLLVAAAVCPGSADGHGEAVDLDTAPDAEAPAWLLERLGAGYLRADVVVVSAPPDGDPAPATAQRPVLTGLFTGPDGSWSVTSQPGRGHAGSPVDGTVRAGPEQIAALTERLREIARAAVRDGVLA